MARWISSRRAALRFRVDGGPLSRVVVAFRDGGPRPRRRGHRRRRRRAIAFPSARDPYRTTLMISRIWHGYTTPGDADAYEALLRAEIFDGIAARRIPGYRGID